MHGRPVKSGLLQTAINASRRECVAMGYPSIGEFGISLALSRLTPRRMCIPSYPTWIGSAVNERTAQRGTKMRSPPKQTAIEVRTTRWKVIC